MRRFHLLSWLLPALVAVALVPSPVFAQPASGDGNPGAAPDNSGGGAGSGEPATDDPLSRYYRDNNVYQGADLNNLVRAGQTSMRTANFDAALGYFEKALALEGKHVGSMHLAGLAMFGRGEFVRAARMLRAAVSRFPTWTRMAFDVVDAFGATRGDEARKQRMAELELATRTAESDGGDTAGELWFLLGYLRYYIAGASPKADDVRPALTAFRNAVARNPGDAAANEFISALAERGFAPDVVPARPEFGLPADRQWLVPGLRQLDRHDWPRASMEFMQRGMSTFRGEPWLWAAIALAADDQVPHAAAMIRRGLLQSDQVALVGIPALADLLPETVITTRRGTLKARSGNGDHEASLVGGYLAFLAGDVPEARQLLADLAAMEQRPKEPDHPARYGPAARWLMKYLPQRTNPPHLDLSRVRDGSAPPANPDPGPATNTNANANAANNAASPPANAGNAGNTNAGTNSNANANTNSNSNSNVPTQPVPPVRTEAEVTADVRAAIQAGDDSLGRRNVPVALGNYLEAIKLGTAFRADWFNSPIRVDIYLKLARVHFALGDYHASYTALDRYLMTVPEMARKAQQVFEAPFAEGAFDGYLRSLSSFVRQTPADRQARFLLAYLQFSARDYIGSFENFTAVVRDAPGDMSFPLADWFINLLVKPPFNADRADPSVRAERIVAEGNKLLADKLYETAALEFQRAYELTPTDAVLTRLIGAQWLRASEDDYSPDMRVEVFRRIATGLRAHILARDKEQWINFRPEFDTVLGAGAKRCRDILNLHVRNKPADFNAWYFRAFVNYFDKNWSECLRSFGEYKDTAREEPTGEFDWFRAGARMQGGNR
ncbi:MAG: hypothetical protein AB7K09_04010 [Planctomycetota bacterium]